MKVLTRNGIRANAALNSEVCAWMETLSGFDTPPFRPRFSQREHVQTGSSGSAEPQSLRVDVSFHRFQRHVFGGSPVRFPCIGDEAVTVGVPRPALRSMSNAAIDQPGDMHDESFDQTFRFHFGGTPLCGDLVDLGPVAIGPEMSERHAGSRNSASSHWAGKLLRRSSRHRICR